MLHQGKNKLLCIFLVRKRMDYTWGAVVETLAAIEERKDEASYNLVFLFMKMWERRRPPTIFLFVLGQAVAGKTKIIIDRGRAFQIGQFLSISIEIENRLWRRASFTNRHCPFSLHREAVADHLDLLLFSYIQWPPTLVVQCVWRSKSRANVEINKKTQKKLSDNVRTVSFALLTAKWTACWAEAASRAGATPLRARIYHGQEGNPTTFCFFFFLYFLCLFHVVVVCFAFGREKKTKGFITRPYRSVLCWRVMAFTTFQHRTTGHTQKVISSPLSKWERENTTIER